MNWVSKTIMVLAALVGLQATVYAGQPPTIELIDQSIVYKPVILLKDVARLVNVNAAIETKLDSLDLGNAPAIGTKRQMDIDYIRLRMRQNGITDSDFEFDGPATITVSRASKQVSSEELFAAAQDYIYKTMPWKKEDIILSAYNIPEDVLVADEAVSMEIIPVRTNLSYQGIIWLTARLHYGQNERIEVPVGINLRRFADVVVSRRDVAKNEMISDTDIVVRREELTHLPKDVIDNPVKASGKIAASPIPAGQVLTQQLLKNPVLVRRQGLVTVIYETPSMVIKTRAIALRDGCSGDIIRVKNIDSQKEINVEVIDNSLARLVL